MCYNANLQARYSYWHDTGVTLTGATNCPEGVVPAS